MPYLAPLGISKTSVLLDFCNFFPEHTGQSCFSIYPLPPHLLQEFWICMTPIPVWIRYTVIPFPLQVEHVSYFLSLDPVPAHPEQISFLSKFTLYL